MKRWLKRLNYDPLAPLMASESEALRYFARSDLLGERIGPARFLWQGPEAKWILRKQLPDGSWPRSGGEKHPAINYGLIETWRNFRYLIEEFGFTREDPRAEKAAEFLFSCQTREGDIRGFLADQYATYYSGAIMALLIKAGYADDPRIERGFGWLLSMRQDDGGWSVPMLTHKLDRATWYRLSSEYAESLQLDRSKPFSHNATGMIIRAFAAHPKYRRSKAAKEAASLLASRFFKPDAYTSYHDAAYWVMFDYPFWWNNLVSALDSLSVIDFPDDGKIEQALNWIVDHQEKDGLWRLSYAKAKAKGNETAKARATRLWVGLAICRILKRFYG